MWPFTRKNKEAETKRLKHIDWNKVQTTEDLISIFKNLGLTSQIRVFEDQWNQHGIDKLLTDEVYVYNKLDYSITPEEPKDNT